jgi:hypothetical protein
MSDTNPVFVYGGIWHSGYEPYDMPGAWVRTQYTLEPADGGGMLPDGRHSGMMTGDRLLCIKSGGEYYAGTVINQTLRDFIVTFDEEFHDEYKAGVERGYKGKRKCSNAYFSRQSQAWQDGYRNGLESKAEQQSKEQARLQDV